MGTIYLYEERGEDGGTWYVAAYPLGATRYYVSEAARWDKVAAYANAIESTGAVISIVDATEAPV